MRGDHSHLFVSSISLTSHYYTTQKQCSRKALTSHSFSLRFPDWQVSVAGQGRDGRIRNPIVAWTCLTHYHNTAACCMCVCGVFCCLLPGCCLYACHACLPAACLPAVTCHLLHLPECNVCGMCLEEGTSISERHPGREKVITHTSTGYSPLPLSPFFFSYSAPLFTFFLLLSSVGLPSLALREWEWDSLVLGHACYLYSYKIINMACALCMCGRDWREGMAAAAGRHDRKAESIYHAMLLTSTPVFLPAFLPKLKTSLLSYYYCLSLTYALYTLPATVSTPSIISLYISSYLPYLPICIYIL